MLANMALAKGHSSKTKSQVSDIWNIGPLVFVLIIFTLLGFSDFFLLQINKNWTNLDIF